MSSRKYYMVPVGNLKTGKRIFMALDQMDYNYCALPLAAYACRPDHSRGRLYPETDSRYRTCFQRDRDRIIHSGAFRRLKYKTQVFVYHQGDHFRTRLSHTLEVAQIARALARALMVNEDLAEGIALAHDLGHPPFAHMGEENLKILMEDLGGFDHNEQSLRVLTHLERSYPKWPGLNMSWEMIEGVIKHNGPVPDEKMRPTFREIDARLQIGLKTHASIEAQVAAIADDVAYNNHDIGDGLRAGLFTLEDLRVLPMPSAQMDRIRAEYPGLDEDLLIQEMLRGMIGEMVDDVLEETERRIRDAAPQSPDDVRACGRQLVAFSQEMLPKIAETRAFLMERMYRHYTINRIWVKVERIIGDLFHHFHAQYALMPDRWQRLVEAGGGVEDETARARIVADYIAGMTDRFAIREHERMFDLYWDLR